MKLFVIIELFIYALTVLLVLMHSSNTRKRTTELEVRIDRLENSLGHKVEAKTVQPREDGWPEKETQSTSVPSAPEGSLANNAVSMPVPIPQKTDPAQPNWFQENWLLKVGAGLLILAVSWFVNYAFVHNWIGPVGRITLGLVFGASLLAFGSIRIRKYLQQGSIFLALGSATILLTTFAARSVYNFFTPREWPRPDVHLCRLYRIYECIIQATTARLCQHDYGLHHATSNLLGSG